MSGNREGLLSRFYLGGLCVITDRNNRGESIGTLTAQALRAGVRWIQYREKGRTRSEQYHEAGHLRAMTREYRAVFIVNDYVDIALAVDADGVHLGQQDLPLLEARKLMGDRIIGISTHSLSEAVAADDGGADYIGFGPIFPTSTKDAGVPQGIGALKEVVGAVSVPVVAIGGITPASLPAVLGAGAAAVAAASAVFRGYVEKNIMAFNEGLCNEAAKRQERLPSG